MGPGRRPLCFPRIPRHPGSGRREDRGITQGLALAKSPRCSLNTCATGTPVVTNSHTRGAVSLNSSPQLEQEYICAKLKCTESKNAFITLPRVPKSQNVYGSERANLLIGAEVPAA